MSEWQPIETAPKGPMILVAYDHDADTYYDPENQHRLTDYAANAEGGDFLSGKGVALAVWCDGYHDSDGWEGGNEYWVPGCWFAWLNGEAADHAVNAIAWMDAPEFPRALAEGTEARRAETGTGSVHEGPVPQASAQQPLDITESSHDHP